MESSPQFPKSLFGPHNVRLIIMAAVGVTLLMPLLELKVAALLLLGLVIVPILLYNGLLAYVLTLPVMIIFRNFGISLDLYVLSSPTDVLVTFGVLAGVIRFAAQDRRLHSSSLYFSIAAFVLIAFCQALLFHRGADVHMTALEKIVRGMWPFAVLLLLLKTPRQARLVLFALLGTMLTAGALWLPGYLYAVTTGQIVLLRAAEIQASESSFPLWSLIASLRTYLFIVPFSTLVAFPVTIFLLIPRYRLWAFIAALLIALLTVTSSVASSLISLIAGIAAALVVFLIVRSRLGDVANEAYSVPLVLLLMLLVPVSYALLRLPVLHYTILRLSDPQADLSAMSRLATLGGAARVFLSHPLFGAPGNHWYGGHDSIVSYAANWGLAFSIPYFAALIGGMLILHRLISRTARPLDQAVLIAMTACIAANILVSIVTPNVIELIADMIIWTFLALAVIWQNWLDEDHSAQLF